ncbi:MAG: O-antigen ligase domain-containing protein [Candidatus Acididesulfobacter diazotrophicus]|uniref:O-antigen ligase domain-containing protein n=1 Tax=Candidatus Acididesulfobacter diazotrophicus TaxID=2597226 RepID=A0A519BPH4_9DELT|nr:MAG: O-antigen ligase domain-containing protein [Candidatus Acididesulfobacter diazotrophicus]
MNIIPIILIIKILVILFSSLFLVFLALKKPELSGFFEKAGLFGIFLFALFIPLKDGFAIFGMVVAIVFFIAYRISKRDFKLPYTVFNKPIIIYVFIVALSFIWTYSIKDSINEGGEIFYFFAFFFAAAALLNTKKRINFIVYTFTFSISIAIIYGLFQGIFVNALHSSNRVTGLIGNWTSFPVQVSYGLIVIMAYYLISFKKQNKGLKYSLKNLLLRLGSFVKSFKKIPSLALSFLLVIIVLLGFLDIVFSKARSAWIGIIPAIFILMYLRSKKFFLMAVILFLVLNIGVFSISKTFKSRMLAMFNPKIYKIESKSHGDIESHLALIESAWTVFKRFPLTGVGVGAFPKYFNEHKEVRFPWYYNPKTGKKLYDLYDNWPENGYMQTLAETGIFGFLSLIFLFILALWQPIKLFISTDDKFKRKIAAMTLGTSVIFYGSFVGVSNMSNDELTNLWFLFLAIFVAALNISNKNKNNQ